MNVSGNLRVDGRISANGMNAGGPGGGGASGGSIWLSTGTISGTGVISVSGGNGGVPYGGGGAGGRIAITYQSNAFTGTIATHGGTGVVAGGAGTLYTKGNFESNGTLIADNGGLSGTNTMLDISLVNLLRLHQHQRRRRRRWRKSLAYGRWHCWQRLDCSRWRQRKSAGWRWRRRRSRLRNLPEQQLCGNIFRQRRQWFCARRRRHNLFEAKQFQRRRDPLRQWESSRSEHSRERQRHV